MTILYDASDFRIAHNWGIGCLRCSFFLLVGWFFTHISMKETFFKKMVPRSKLIGSLWYCGSKSRWWNLSKQIIRNIVLLTEWLSRYLEGVSNNIWWQLRLDYLIFSKITTRVFLFKLFASPGNIWIIQVAKLGFLSCLSLFFAE